MTVALYPASPKPLLGYSIEPMFYTQKTPTKSGADVTEKMWDTARYKITLPYRVSVTNAATLLNFHEARYGSYEAFDFIDFHSRAWTGVYIGVGDGVENTFEIPINDGSPVVYVDSVLQTFSTDYIVSRSAGTNGRDWIVFQAGHIPPDGDDITIDMTGYRYHTVRFESDNLRYRTLPQFSGGVEMLELQVSLISQR